VIIFLSIFIFLLVLESFSWRSCDPEAGCWDVRGTGLARGGSGAVLQNGTGALSEKWAWSFPGRAAGAD